MRKICIALLSTLLMAGASFPALAGRIVLANDEWTLSNSGYTSPNDPAQFALNVADWFTGGGSGSFLAFSNNFGLTGSSLAGTMTGAGHSWTVTTLATQFTLANLSTFDGVYLGGNAPPGTLAAYSQILTDYVNAGGNVYLMGGTGAGGAGAEAARWNTFLGNFGLQFASFYQGTAGSIAISSPHPIFASVDHLFQNNGQDTLDIAVADPRSAVLVTVGGHGLYAVFDGVTAVPLPGTLLLFGAGLAVLGLGQRRKA